MMAVSVRRPYADAIFDVGCQVISREDDTRFRGTLAIRSSPSHADVSPAAIRVRHFRDDRCGTELVRRGSLLGIAELVDTHSIDDCEMAGPCAVDATGMSFAKFFSHRPRIYHWILRNPRRAEEPVRVVAAEEEPIRHAPVWELPSELALRLQLATLVRIPSAS